MKNLDAGQGLGAAYEHLRNTIDRLLCSLGGDNFARSVVTVGARESLQQVVRPSRQTGCVTHMSFCEALVASPERLLAATDHLERTFARRDGEMILCGVLGNGRLVVRGWAMYYETESAASMIAHYFEPYASNDRWTTSMTPAAETYLAEHKMQRPSISVAHTKTEDAALKALVRIAKQHFGVTLEKQAVSGKN